MGVPERSFHTCGAGGVLIGIKLGSFLVKILYLVSPQGTLS